MPTLHLQGLVDRLEAANVRNLDLAAVTALVADGEIDPAELRRFVGPRQDTYARRLMYRGPAFEVMVLTWAPGQFTPVHDHAGSRGWVRLVRGRLVEDTYRPAASHALPQSGGRFPLVPTGSRVVDRIGAVATVDAERAIHRLGNPEPPGGEIAVTLHVYAPPHDTCLVFDPANGTCSTRQLRFDAPPS